MVVRSPQIRKRKKGEATSAERIIFSAMVRRGMGVEDLAHAWKMTQQGAYRRIRNSGRMTVTDFLVLAHTLGLTEQEASELLTAAGNANV